MSPKELAGDLRLLAKLTHNEATRNSFTEAAEKLDRLDSIESAPAAMPEIAARHAEDEALRQGWGQHPDTSRSHADRGILLDALRAMELQAKEARARYNSNASELIQKINDITGERDAALAESASRYDCHGGPGTTEPACDRCVACLLRTEEGLRAEVAGLKAERNQLAEIMRSKTQGKDPSSLAMLDGVRSLRNSQDRRGAFVGALVRDFLAALPEYQGKTGTLRERFLAVIADLRAATTRDAAGPIEPPGVVLTSEGAIILPRSSATLCPVCERSFEMGDKLVGRFRPGQPGTLVHERCARITDAGNEAAPPRKG